MFCHSAVSPCTFSKLPWSFSTRTFPFAYLTKFTPTTSCLVFPFALQSRRHSYLLYFPTHELLSFPSNSTCSSFCFISIPVTCCFGFMLSRSPPFTRCRAHAQVDHVLRRAGELVPVWPGCASL